MLNWIEEGDNYAYDEKYHKLLHKKNLILRLVISVSEATVIFVELDIWFPVAEVKLIPLVPATRLILTVHVSYADTVAVLGILSVRAPDVVLQKIFSVIGKVKFIVPETVVKNILPILIILLICIYGDATYEADVIVVFDVILPSAIKLPDSLIDAIFLGIKPKLATQKSKPPLLVDVVALPL